MTLIKLFWVDLPDGSSIAYTVSTAALHEIAYEIAKGWRRGSK